MLLCTKKDRLTQLQYWEKNIFTVHKCNLKQRPFFLPRSFQTVRLFFLCSYRIFCWFSDLFFLSIRGIFIYFFLLFVSSGYAKFLFHYGYLHIKGTLAHKRTAKNETKKNLNAKWLNNKKRWFYTKKKKVFKQNQEHTLATEVQFFHEKKIILDFCYLCFFAISK